MAGKKGHYGSGTIAPSGKNSWRIRYRIDGKLHEVPGSGEYET